MATEILPDRPTLEMMESMAERLAAVPGNIAYRMAENGITAADLGISREQAAHLRLCLLPRPATLEQDIATIARTAGITTEQARKAAGR